MAHRSFAAVIRILLALGAAGTILSSCNLFGLPERNNPDDPGSTATVGPGTPTELSVDAVTDTTATLSWTDNADNETGFVLERKTGADGTWEEAATPTADATSYTDSGLTAETAYTYRIKAVNTTDNTESAWSNEASGTTEAVAATPPANPTNLSVESVTDTSATLAWTDNADNETGFVLERKTGADGTWAEAATPAADATSHTDTGLTAETTYYYRIKAVNTTDNTESGWSNEASGTTEATGTAFTLTQADAGYYIDVGKMDTDSNRGTGQEVTYASAYVPETFSVWIMATKPFVSPYDGSPDGQTVEVTLHLNIWNMNAEGELLASSTATVANPNGTYSSDHEVQFTITGIAEPIPANTAVRYTVFLPTGVADDVRGYLRYDNSGGAEDLLLSTFAAGTDENVDEIATYNTSSAGDLTFKLTGRSF